MNIQAFLRKSMFGTVLMIGCWLAGTVETASAQSPDQICVPQNASETMQFAATEMQKYIHQMTGQTPAIVSDSVSLIGTAIVLSSKATPNAKAEPIIAATELPVLDSDAFFLRSTGGLLVIGSGAERGVLFGVYDFLERNGCRWFGPGEELVPSVPSLPIGSLNVYSEPELKWRALELISGSDVQIVDWMAKVKLNVAWPEKYVPNSDMSASTSSMNQAAIPEMTKRGLQIFWGGHILPVIFPESSYSNHPEYFAEINGGRLNSGVDEQSRWQLCTGNDVVMQILTQNTIQFLQNHPWITVLFVWGNDTEKWCGCSQYCLPLVPNPNISTPYGPDRSDLYCRMIKIINEGIPGKFPGVRDVLPGRKLAFNHYYNLEGLPQNLNNLPDSGNVISAVDAYAQCDRHTFNDPSCYRGKRVQPIAEMWTPYYPQSVSWSYYWSWNFMKGLPISMVHKIPSDFRLIHGLGVQGVVDNVSIAPNSLLWANSRLNFYMYAKASWDTSLDEAAIVSDYINHYYGAAAAPMAQFWQCSDDATRKFGVDPQFIPENSSLGTSSAIHGWMQNIQSLVPNHTIFNQMIGYLDQADTLASTQPYRTRVQIIRASIEEFDPPLRSFKPFPFFNGGGYNINLLYGWGDEINCSVFNGNNIGDAFWPQPYGTPLLNTPGDYATVRVKINQGWTETGEPLYRSGPGLYLSQDQNDQAGGTGHHDAIFMITEENKLPYAFVTLNDGSYGSAGSLWSDANVWTYGQWVKLRIDYLDNSGGHKYQFSYGSDGIHWTKVGSFTSQTKMPYVGPCHKWAGYYYGAQTHFPLLNWAAFTGFGTGHGDLPTPTPTPEATPTPTPLANQFGFFNGGGRGGLLSYFEINGEVHCLVNSGNNIGDCFWPTPLETQQLVNIGDEATVQVRINVGTEDVGEPLYRSGPGLFQAENQTQACGTANAHSVMLFISNMDSDNSRPRQVITIQNNGAYGTFTKGSPNNFWDYGDWVDLKIKYVNGSEGHYLYEYLYWDGSDWQKLTTFDSTVKLPFVAPMHKWGVLYYGVNARYPIVDWAAFRNFMFGRTGALNWNQYR